MSTEKKQDFSKVSSSGHSGAENLSERDFIAKIRSVCSNGVGDILTGIGDDCAVLKNPGSGTNWLVTTDTLVDGIHFDRSWHSPFLLGKKAAAVNISDVAAMGGKPKFALLAMGVCAELRGQWLDDFIKGFIEQLSAYNTVLVGGDTVGCPSGVFFNITIIGQGESSTIILRNGACVGDSVWVSGPLGGASAGLALCRAGHTDKNIVWPELFKAHLDPEPQVELGGILAQSGLVHAMQDISDGLATDLGHLCKESGVGAEVEQELLPAPEFLEEASHFLGQEPLDWQVRGGEDYQLLFTAAAEHDQVLPALVKEKTGRPIFRIGRIVDKEGVVLRNFQNTLERIDFQGYDHFSGV